MMLHLDRSPSQVITADPITDSLFSPINDDLKTDHRPPELDTAVQPESEHEATPAQPEIQSPALNDSGAIEARSPEPPVEIVQALSPVHELKEPIEETKPAEDTEKAIPDEPAVEENVEVNEGAEVEVEEVEEAMPSVEEKVLEVDTDNVDGVVGAESIEVAREEEEEAVVEENPAQEEEEQPEADHLTPLTDVSDEESNHAEETEEGVLEDMPKNAGEQNENTEEDEESTKVDDDRPIPPALKPAEPTTPEKVAAPQQVVEEMSSSADVPPPTSVQPQPSTPAPQLPKPHLKSSPNHSKPATPSPPGPSQPPRLVNGKAAAPTASDTPKSLTPTSSPSRLDDHDSKASVLLEINAELFKLYIEFQGRNLLHTPEYKACSDRLQANLTWLAASADKSRSSESLAAMPPPILEVVPPIAFADLTNLRRLYGKMPLLFAKDVARRQQMLKRPREQEEVGSISRKRQDTGDSKLAPSPSRSDHVADNPSMINGILPPGAPNPMSVGPPPGTGIIQPSVPPGMGILPGSQMPRISHSNSNLDLQRQAQLRQLAQRQGQGSPPPPPQIHSASMSPAGHPPPTLNMAPQQQPALPGGEQHHNTSSHANAPLSQAQLQQVQHMLQDPNNQIVKFLISKDPQFLSKPLSYQISGLQAVQRQAQQMRMHQARMANPQGAGQPPGAGGMMDQNHVRPGMTMNNPGQPPGMHQQAGHHPMAGGSPSMPTSDAMAMNATPQSRPGSSQMINLGGANMTPQQRQQLIMMQQQQQMRQVSPTHMPPQPGYGMPQSQQPQPPFHHSTSHDGSPYMEGGDAQNRPRSESGVSAAGRSTRSPSEPAGSPTKRNASFSQDPYHQALMNSTGQHAAQQQQMSQLVYQQQQMQQRQQLAQSTPQPQQGQGGWPNPSPYNAGMNPASFQLNQHQHQQNQPQNQNPQQMYINPAALSGGPQMANPGPTAWNSAPSPYSHSSPPPSMHPHDPASRHVSATPAPNPHDGSAAGSPQHIDPSATMYQQWS